MEQQQAKNWPVQADSATLSERLKEFINERKTTAYDAPLGYSHDEAVGWRCCTLNILDELNGILRETEL